jgi:hypothetical protein
MRSCVVSWDQRFAEPIVLPDGVRLASLREGCCAGGPIEFARIATLRAINRRAERAFNPDRKITTGDGGD